jgi:Rrf2 family protein
MLRHDITQMESIPESFMAKILKRLVNSGLLLSSRGIRGGFALARTPSEITLMEIIEAVEGPISVTPCVPDPDGCEFSGFCPAYPVWWKVQLGIAQILRDSDLKTLASQAPVSPDL